MSLKTIDDVVLGGKKVYLRVDFNVPLDEWANITDDTRIRAAVPTIKTLLEKNVALVIASHLGRPTGFDSSLSLRPIAKRLGQILRQEVKFAPDCVGDDVERMKANLRPGEILLLENVRFHPEETKNDEEFARQLASQLDAYVIDAFSAAHRAHASVVGVARFLKPVVAGYLMAKEIQYLDMVLKEPQRPLIAIIGGKKLQTKLPVIKHLLQKVDHLILGGGMIFTFFKAKGLEVGSSIVDLDFLSEAKQLLSNERLILPVDCKVADRIGPNQMVQNVSVEEIPRTKIGVDIGDETIKRYCELIKKSKTLLWNGPMGIFEYTTFADGTKAVAQAIAETASAGGIAVVGGGETVAAVNRFGVAEQMSHISTAGGAFLEYLSGTKLPGVEILYA
ncbi:phosphoglycerate kinase [candidate division WOR-3 bacterium]|uniref:Phosphoglycerate kinase n=1 Tax=candidate division WOR-3 bacterium TaxID=2052148 RepID=A0A660SN23_UNCW3|nr:MAG: phosphoglycerate kinase [candidate division WOR-3 bacterium]